MKQDFFHSLQDQLERAGDSGEPARRQRWRALRRWLRALWRRRLRVAAAVGVGVLVTLGVAASLDRSVLHATVQQVSSATAAGSPASGRYASDVTTTSMSSAAPGALASVRAGADAQAAAADTDTETVAAGSPVSLSFSPRSVTAISEYEWWILGKSSCDGTSCNTIVRTTTGGYSFVQIPAPADAEVSGLRFADQLDGYVYEPQLWSTHDGGEHWHRVHIAGQVQQLATAGGYVFAVVEGAHGGALWRSPIGADRWQRLPAAGRAQSLWVQGQSVLVDSRSKPAAAAALRYSSDNGSSFKLGAKNPSGSVAFACDYDETMDGTIWSLCGAGSGGSEVTAYRSVDRGASFQAAGGAGTVRSMESPTLAAASAATAVAGTDAGGRDGGGASLLRTSDGGKSWHAAELTGLSAGAKLLRVSYLGFTDATHGVAIIELRVSVSGANGTVSQADSWRLYYTTDAGASYHYVPISG